MNSRIIVAAVLALTASAGAAHAEIAPSYDANGVCALYALSVDPRFCEDRVDPAGVIGVDTVVTGGIEDRVPLPGVDVAPTSDILPKGGKYIVAPNAGGHSMIWTPSGHADGLLVEVITP
jgi:hypothetical protein